jgi:hypothetical protein
MTRVWFTETIQWCVDTHETDRDAIEKMIFQGDERIWEYKDFVDSELTIDEMVDE